MLNLSFFFVQGGVNIEEVAEQNPDAIKKYPLPLTSSNQVDVELAERIASEAFGIYFKLNYKFNLYISNPFINRFNRSKFN